MWKVFEWICQPAQPRLKRIVHIFSLIVFVLSGLVFLYHLGESIYFSLSFPNGSRLEGCVWMMQISLLFLFLWMPAIIFLSKHYMTNPVAVVIYLVGIVFAILLSIISVSLVGKYLERGVVRGEYQELVSKSIKENNKLPRAVLFTVSSHECCGWKGAIDFGVSFNISDKVKKDYNFMKDLEICYGKTWTVHEAKNGELEYKDGSKSSEAMPEGCNMFYKQLFHRNCLLIFYFNLLVDFLGVVFIVFTILLYTSSKTQTSSAATGSLPPRGSGSSGKILPTNTRSSASSNPTNVEENRDSHSKAPNDPSLTHMASI